MRIINITNGAFATLLLASSIAGAETQYPASDFQPKVVYQDPEYKQSPSAATSAQPSSSSTSAAADAKYPAANFQPKVVYNDPTYKHAASKSTSGSTVEAQQGAGAAQAAVAAEESKDQSSMNYLIGLAVLAFVGIVFFRKQSRPEAGAAGSASGSYRVTTGSAGGLTGVAKYINRSSGTGVSRYLEKNVKSAATAVAATGVAKYMAKQVGSEKTTSAEAATGVEKYMRKRG